MAKIFLALTLALLAVPVRAAKVKMCVDEACAQKVKREKLDCTIHKNKTKALTLGFKVSVAFAAKAGPEVSFGRSTQINWGRMSQELIRRYEELCDMHNKGHLSVAEFNRRYDKLEAYYDKAKDLKQEVEDTLEGRVDKAFKELDEEAAKVGGESVALKDKVKRLSGDIDALAGEVKSESPSEAGEPESQKAR